MPKTPDGPPQPPIKKESLNGSSQHHHEVSETTWRNWVIKTLCGMSNMLMTKFIEHFPELEDDFLTLSVKIDECTEKCRAVNRQYLSEKSGKES